MHPDPRDPPTQPLPVPRPALAEAVGNAPVVTGPVVAGPVVAGPVTLDGRVRPPWTFVDVFVGLGVVLLASTLLSAVVRLSGATPGPALLLLSALPVWVGLLGTAIWACRRHGTGNLVADLALRFRWIDLFIGLGAGVGLRVAIGLWTIFCARVTGSLPQGNLQDVLDGNGLGTGVWLVVNMAAIAVVGPVIEEIFFRGVGLRGALASLLRRSGTNPRLADPRRRARLAIAATAAVFALLHVSEVNDAVSALALLPGLFAAGAVLGWLTIRFGRLGPAIVTHVVFNGVAVVALLVVAGSA